MLDLASVDCGVSDLKLGAGMIQSVSEATLSLHLRVAGIRAIAEFQFAHPRKYRADFLIDGTNLLIECDGGNRLGTIGKDGKAYAIGRHTQDEDMMKLNLAAELGYRVLRFSPKMVKSGLALQTIERILKGVKA